MVLAFIPSTVAFASIAPKHNVTPSAKVHPYPKVYVLKGGETFAGKSLEGLKNEDIGITPDKIKAKLALLGQRLPSVMEDVDPTLNAKHIQVILVFDRPKIKPTDKAALEDEKSFHLNVAKELETKVKSFKKITDYYYAINGMAAAIAKDDLKSLQDAFKSYGKVYVAKRYSVLGWPQGTEPSSFAAVPEMVHSPELIGAAQLHDMGITGSGTIVAILDTGIRPDHEFFYKNGTEPEACTPWTDLSGPDKKFYGGKDYYSYEDWDGNIYFDDDPTVGSCYEDPNGHPHGTHVAGTVAGVEGNPIAGLTPVGVAPDAQLWIAKVFPGEPPYYASDVSIISAIEDIIAEKENGANIVAANMSLGATGGFNDPNDPEQQAIETAINEYGISFAIAAGNDGHFLDGSYPQATDAIYPLNLGVVSSPGTTPEAITVAASYNSGVVRDAFQTNVQVNGDNLVAYVWAPDTPDPKQVLTDPTEIAIADPVNLTACNLDDLVDLTGKIALIKRGTCTFEQKINNAYQKGAVGVIVYNHEQGGDDYVYMAVGSATHIPAVFIGNTDGTALYSLISGGTTVTAQFGEGIYEDTALDPNKMADFSSWGALPSLLMKPDVAAPGYGIYSSTISSQDSYEVWGGTSMATPHVAGAIALLKQLYPNATPAEIKRALVNHADPLVTYYSDGTPTEDIAPRKQGAGRINVLAAAADFDSYMVTTGFVNEEFNDKPIASLGLIQQLPVSFAVKIHNGSGSDRTYTIIPQVFSSAAPGFGIFPASATVSQQSVEIPAGGDATVIVTITDTSLIGWIEGRVFAVADDGTYMQLPFGGLYDPAGPYYYGDPSLANTYGTAYIGGANPASDWAWFSPARYLDYFGYYFGEQYAVYEGWTGWWDMLYLMYGYIKPLGVDYAFNYSHLWSGTPMFVFWWYYLVPDFNYTAMRGIWDFKIDIYKDNADYNADPMATPQPGDFVETMADWGTGHVRKSFYGFYYCNDEGCYYNMWYDSDLDEGRYVAAVYAKPKAVVDPYGIYGSDVPAQFVGYFPIAVDWHGPEIDGASPVIVDRDSAGNPYGLKVKIVNPRDDLTGVIGYDVYITFNFDVNGDGYVDSDDEIYVPVNWDEPTAEGNAKVVDIDLRAVEAAAGVSLDPDGDGDYVEHVAKFRVDVVDGAFWNVTTAADIDFSQAIHMSLTPGWNSVGLPLNTEDTIAKIFTGIDVIGGYALVGNTFYNWMNSAPEPGYGYFIKYKGSKPIDFYFQYLFAKKAGVEYASSAAGWFDVSVDQPTPVSDLKAYKLDGDEQVEVPIVAIYAYENGAFKYVKPTDTLDPLKGYLIKVTDPIDGFQWREVSNLYVAIVDDYSSLTQNWIDTVSNFTDTYDVIDSGDLASGVLNNYNLVVYVTNGSLYNDEWDAITSYFDNGGKLIMGEAYDLGYYEHNDSNYTTYFHVVSWDEDDTDATLTVGAEGTPFEGLQIPVDDYHWPDAVTFEDDVDTLGTYANGDYSGYTSIAGYKGDYSFVYVTFRWTDLDETTQDLRNAVFQAMLQYLGLAQPSE